MPTRRSLLLALPILLHGCGLPDGYRGDGDFSDRGVRTATNRYILDLGPLESGTSVYSVKGLPAVEFSFGFQIDDLPVERVAAALSRHDVLASLTLTTAEGETVFEHTGELSDWVWSSGVTPGSGSFAYRRGKYRELPRPDGAHELERIRTGADGGWGTYFEPRRTREYRLQVTVSSTSDFFSFYTIRLLATGGGWK